MKKLKKLLEFSVQIACLLFMMTVFQSHKKAAPLVGDHPLKNFSISPPEDVFAVMVVDSSKVGVNIQEVEVVKSTKKHRKELKLVAESTAVIPDPVKIENIIESVDTFAERLKHLNYHPKIGISRHQ